MVKDFFDIRTGVIGAGSMGSNHARLYNDISNFIGIYDIDSIRAEEISSKTQSRSFKSMNDLFEEVDAVSIAVPTIHHRDVALKAFEYGVHTLVEKPLSQDIDESSEIVRTFDTSSLKLAVGHVERHNNAVKLAKKTLHSGIWGDLISITARRFSNYPKRISDVGVIFDLSIHDIDVINYLVDSDIESVYCAGSSVVDKKQEDNVNIVLSFKNGVTGVCQTNWLTPMKIRELLITTSAKHVKVDYLNQEIEVTTSKFLSIDEANLYEAKIDYETEKLLVKKSEPLREELLDFLSSISKDKNPFVTGFDGFQAVKIANHALESMTSNKAIVLEGGDK